MDRNEHEQEAARWASGNAVPQAEGSITNSRQGPAASSGTLPLYIPREFDPSQPIFNPAPNAVEQLRRSVDSFAPQMLHLQSEQGPAASSGTPGLYIPRKFDPSQQILNAALNAAEQQRLTHDPFAVHQPPVDPGPPTVRVYPDHSEFTKLYGPRFRPTNKAGPPEIGKDLDTIVHKLMTPGEEYYNEDRSSVTLNKAWAVGIVGQEHFMPRYTLRRLLEDDQLNVSGLSLRLDPKVLGWLNSDVDEIQFESNIFTSYAESFPDRSQAVGDTQW